MFILGRHTSQKTHAYILHATIFYPPHRPKARQLQDLLLQVINTHLNPNRFICE